MNDRVPQWALRGLTIVLTLVTILSGDWFISQVHHTQAFTTPQAVFAVEGCGTGVNSSYKMETYSDGGVRYFFAQDTCRANASSTAFRDRANDADLCATRFGTGATMLSLLGVVVSSAGPLGGVGALFGFAIAGDCAITRGTLNGVANKIQKANQECGTQGISFEMRVRKDLLEVYEFRCQPAKGKTLIDIAVTPITARLVPNPHPEDVPSHECDPARPSFSTVIWNDGTEFHTMALATDATGTGGHNFKGYLWNPETGLYEPMAEDVWYQCTTDDPPAPVEPPSELGADGFYIPHPAQGNMCSSIYYTTVQYSWDYLPDGTTTPARLSNYKGVFAFAEYDGLDLYGEPMWFYRYNWYKFNPVTGEYDFYTAAASALNGEPCHSAAP